MYYSRNQQLAYGAAIVIGVVVMAALIYFAITYRRPPERIRILDRWWATTKWVKWDEQVIKTTITWEETCTGLGENERCVKYPVTTIETETVTHTRCTSHASGKSLPIFYPEPGCELRSNDYIRTSKIFKIRYENSEGTIIDAPFKESLWSDLPPGFDRAVVSNLFGHITSLAVE